MKERIRQEIGARFRLSFLLLSLVAFFADRPCVVLMLFSLCSFFGPPALRESPFVKTVLRSE